MVGDYYAPGESYWVGQHNAEYIGKSEYATNQLSSLGTCLRHH